MGIKRINMRVLYLLACAFIPLAVSACADDPSIDCENFVAQGWCQYSKDDECCESCKDVDVPEEECLDVPNTTCNQKETPTSSTGLISLRSMTSTVMNIQKSARKLVVSAKIMMS